MIPTIKHYGRDENTLSLYFANYTLHYSYTTLVAFQFAGHPMVVRKNDWQQTTGKHLNVLEAHFGGCKADRLDATSFNHEFKMQSMGVFE